MLKIKTITMKNFLSVGAVTQAVNLEENGLTLILGDNLDQGSNGNRNGAGKSTLLHAISYALYGIPMTNIKKDNLINKTNGKNMLVSIEFEKNGHTYKIERGRKPTLFRFIVDNNVVNEAQTDESQGDSRFTQNEITKIIGFSHLLFKHMVALSTKTTPFLNEKATPQRELIEELLGITQLSQKAEALRELIKLTKTEIDQEEFKIKLVKQQNEKTLRTINEIKLKASAWERKHNDKIAKLEAEIEKLREVDINEELANHKTLERYIALEREYKESKKAYMNEQHWLTNLSAQIEKLEANYKSLLDHKCHACGQEIHDSHHTQLLEQAECDLQKACEAYIDQEAKFKIAEEIYETKKNEFSSIGQKPTVFYSSIDEAYTHKNNLDMKISNLDQELKNENPFIDQIKTIEDNNIQEYDYENLNNLTKLKEHQEFLLKLLTDKNSWVRKQIIEQNLGYLNHRLEFYIQKLGLPHQVKFMSDLSVEITKLGQDFDFDNLSTGESTRCILALSWAFRDVFETLNFPINLMMIDELIDNGLDASGGENSLAVLKYTTREFGKNIFLVSHKDEFIARVSNVLLASKENGFTTYSYETDVQV